MARGLADYQTPESGSEKEVLSTRQREILSLLTQGKANKEIAYELGIGIGTVKQHLVALYKKMGVTNRAMAVSKGISSHDTLRANADPDTGKELYLERRSAVVLSIQVAPEAGLIDEDYALMARRIMSQCATEADALFLGSPDARGDVIFGLERTRRYDCLRATRLAHTVKQEIESKLGPSFKVRCGMSCGFVLKGISDDESWTGEVIAIDVISEARQNIPKAKESVMGVSQSALAALQSLGMCLDNKDKPVISLNATFRWCYCETMNEITLFGRETEQKLLAQAFAALDENAPNTICIESGPGMGRTALVRAYANDCKARGVSVRFFKALMPNSRPMGKSRGLIEPMDEPNKPMALKAFVQSLFRQKDCVIVVEDCHAMSPGDFEVLVTPSARLAANGVLLILTYSGRVAPEIKSLDGVDVTRIGRLDNKSVAALAMHQIGKKGRLLNWVIDKSNGVPAFIVSLASAGKKLSENADYERMPVPYDLFSMIEERIDALGVRRGLLFAAANDDDALIARTPKDDVSRAIKAGFLKKNTEISDNKSAYSFVNPTVAWVVAHSFVRRNSVFAR